MGTKPLDAPAMSDLWKPVQLVPYVRTLWAAKVTSVLCIVQIGSEWSSAAYHRFVTI